MAGSDIKGNRRRIRPIQGVLDLADRGSGVVPDRSRLGHIQTEDENTLREIKGKIETLDWKMNRMLAAIAYMMPVGVDAYQLAASRLEGREDGNTAAKGRLVPNRRVLKGREED